jgi:hypothetical protein
MQYVSLTNKTNTTTLKRKEKVLSVYELPFKLVNFYTLANARTVSPCDALLQGSSAMALDVRCATKGPMWEMRMSERARGSRTW